MKSISLCLACVGLSLLTACQSTDKPPVTRNIEVNQQTQHLLEAKESLEQLKKDIAQAREEQLSYFAPKTFKEAIIEFDKAAEEYGDVAKNGVSSLNIFKSETEQYEEANQEIMSYIALSNQKLKFAYNIKKTAESTLAETFTQKAILKRIGTPQIYSKEYQMIDIRIHELVKNIDSGDVSKAQAKQPALLVDMKALELRSVRKSALSQIDKDIAIVKKKGLLNYVPISFKRVLTARANADAVITNDPRASAEIKAAVELAEFELAHLNHIAKEVNALKKINKNSFEKYLLAKETLLHSVSESLGTKDVRDLALSDQIKSIALQAKAIKGKLTSANDTVLALKNDNTQSTAAAENLSVGFTSQLISLNNKYDALVIENAELAKTVESKNLKIIRLEAYKEAVMQVEGKHAAEKALALKAKSKKEAEQKALALKEKAEKEAIALAEKTKKEAEQKALAMKEQAKEKAAALNEQSKKAAEEQEVSIQEPEVAVEEASIVEVKTEVAEVAEVAEVKVVGVKTIEQAKTAIESN